MPSPVAHRHQARTRLLGAVAVVAAGAGAVLLPGTLPWKWPAVLALAFAGLSTILVLWEPTTPSATADGLVAGASASLDGTLEANRLEGPPVYLPGSEPGGPEVVFVPAADSDKPRPVVEEARSLYAGEDDRQAGVAIPPPGRPLLEAGEDRLGRDIAGSTVPEALDILEGLGESTGLYRRLDLRRHEDHAMTVTYEPQVATPCLGATAEDGDGHPSTGCPVCSLLVTGLVRVLERPLEVTAIRSEDDRVRVELQGGG